jgi:hypothetical protein
VIAINVIAINLIAINVIAIERLEFHPVRMPSKGAETK